MICTVKGEDITIHNVQSVGQYDICTVRGVGGYYHPYCTVCRSRDVVWHRPSANRRKLLKMAEKSAVHLAYWAERFTDETAQVCPF